ncbi:MAG: NAD(P)-dependent oxidoreductase [Saccharofermentanales bacterium]
MKIVFLDRNSIGEDVDVNVFARYGDLVLYDFTSLDEVRERIADADIVITNKARLNASTLSGSGVRLVCVTATGTDNVDIRYCRAEGIAVCNVKGYSTESVVQITFTLLFTLWSRVLEYSDYTSSGQYIGDSRYGHFRITFSEMNGKNFGIIGLGAIGTRVAEVAKALGFNVFYWSSSNVDRNPAYQRLSLDDLLGSCDVISINSPLNDRTRHLLGIDEFRKMKKTALLLNVGRGMILREEDLANAIEDRLIGGAALDVLAEEPMSPSSPFVRLLGRPDFFLTPHVAWAAVEARNRCISEICLNIDAWLNATIRNRVDLQL